MSKDEKIRSVVDSLVDPDVSICAIGKCVFPIDSGQLQLYLIIANEDAVLEQFDSHSSDKSNQKKNRN